MRVSTSQYFADNTTRILKTQAEINITQEKVSSGVNVDTPAEDPLLYATGLRAKNSLVRIDQYQRNMVFAQNFLSEMEVVMENAGEGMKIIKERLVQGANPLYSQRERLALATELEGLRTGLLSAANARDSGGAFIFSGTNSLTETFAVTPEVPAGPMGVPAGIPAVYTFNGTSRDTSPVGAKVGIEFEVADNRKQDLDINGEDAFTYVDSTGVRVNIFEAVDRAILALKESDSTTTDRVRASLRDLDAVFSNLQLARAEVGARQREMEAVDNEFISIRPELERVASAALDTNMVQAISDLAQYEFQLKAQQQSFANTAKVSLFDYL